jgi:hypothetical protein
VGEIHNFLKTETGIREGDLHPSVAGMLNEFIGDKQNGLLFCSKTGKQLWQTNILRRGLHPVLALLNQQMSGAHAFRRFRLTHMRKHNVPKDLKHFWMGHRDENIGDIYSKLEEDVAFRREVTERIGLGFDLPPKIEGSVKLNSIWNQNCSFGPNGPKTQIGETEEVAVTD